MDPFDSLTRLGVEQASSLAALPLAGLRREYPNKMDHVMLDGGDVCSPRQCHPAFYGCFDWHSSVHGHWMLARLLKSFPDLPQAGAVEKLFCEHFTEDNLKREAEYLSAPGRKSFERPYGWAWLLKLAEELHAWNDPRAQKWSQAMAPLSEAAKDRYMEFFPEQTYPIRSGVHSNTAFGLAFALDYARAVGDGEFESMLVERALTYFGDDRDYPAEWEPGGDHFFSPALIEVCLMSRVLSGNEFSNWLCGFLPGLADGHPRSLLQPAVVNDRSDPKIVHLDGLNLSRCWAFRETAARLPQNDRRQPHLLTAARAHTRATLEHINSGHYEGEHWLASFAVYFHLGHGRVGS